MFCSDKGVTLFKHQCYKLFTVEIYVINSVDKTKLSCDTPTDAVPQFLQKLPHLFLYFPILDIFRSILNCEILKTVNHCLIFIAWLCIQNNQRKLLNI